MSTADVPAGRKRLHHGTSDRLPVRRLSGLLGLDWLSSALSSGTIGSIERVRDELTSLEDRLQDWVDDQVGLDLTPDDATIEALRELAVWTMAEERFVPAAKTEFLDVADYFLVGQAIAGGHIVVTNEVAQPEG